MKSIPEVILIVLTTTFLIFTLIACFNVIKKENIEWKSFLIISLLFIMTLIITLRANKTLKDPFIMSTPWGIKVQLLELPEKN